MFHRLLSCVRAVDPAVLYDSVLNLKRVADAETTAFANDLSPIMKTKS